MKMIDRQPVEGTTPTINIGHRPYADKHTGEQRVSKAWYAEYCLDGRHYYEALGTSNKSTAVKKAHAIVHRIEAGQVKSPSRRVELAVACDAYVEMLRNRGRAPKTLQKYEKVLQTLVHWAAARGVHRASGFGERDFWAFNQKMTEDGLAPKTRYTHLTIIKQLLKWAAKSGMIATSPLAGLRLDKPAPTKQPCFTPDQVATLLEKADAHLKPIFTIMAYAGLRFGEVRDLLWTDLLLDQGRHGYIFVHRGGSGGTTKDKEARRIPIHPELRVVLEGLPRNFERVFTARPSKEFPKGGGILDERRLLMSLKRLCRRCSFLNPQQYKLHTLRHAFASMCARNSVSYKYALEWMGHSSSEILDLYYTMFDETAEVAIRTIQYEMKDPTNNAPAA